MALRTPNNPVPLRCKARVVIAGHNDVDLEKGLRTDAPTVTRLSTYLVLVLCASLDMAPHSADVEAAFLQTGEAERLKHRFYLRQPREGFPGLASGQLVAVLKPLFGFADSPRAWWLTFRENSPT